MRSVWRIWHGDVLCTRRSVASFSAWSCNALKGSLFGAEKANLGIRCVRTSGLYEIGSPVELLLFGVWGGPFLVLLIFTIVLIVAGSGVCTGFYQCGYCWGARHLKLGATCLTLCCDICDLVLQHLRLSVATLATWCCNSRDLCCNSCDLVLQPVSPPVLWLHLSVATVEQQMLQSLFLKLPHRKYYSCNNYFGLISVLVQPAFAILLIVICITGQRPDILM